MSVWRGTGGTGALVASLGTLSIPANPSRLTLKIGTAAVQKFALYAGATADPLKLVATMNSTLGFIYFSNVQLGELIQGEFTIQNLGANTEVVTWLETIYGT